MDFNNDSGLLSNVTAISSSTSTLTFESSGAVVLPVGITSQRPTFANGLMRLNSETGFVEVSSNGVWVDIKDYSLGSAISATVLNTVAKNNTLVTLPKGTPVYQVGTAGSSFTLLVEPADAADPAKMPAVGVLNVDLAPAAEGELLLLGNINGVNTSTFLEGDLVYVAAGGGYTNVKPTATNVEIQLLGIVTKIHATNGGGVITGTGAPDYFRKDPAGYFSGWDGTAWIPLVQNIDDLGDVTVTSPLAGQVVQYNGTAWTNGGSTPSSASGILNSWTLVSGTRYYADFAHNLGTYDLVVQLYDSLTNKVIQADSIVEQSLSTIRVTVIGNTRSIRIVVIANGLAVGIMNGGGVPVIIEDLYANRPAAGVEGRLFIAYDSKVFYRDNGTSWDIVSASSGTVKTYTFYANSLDSPTTADFAVNALAPVISDPTNTAMNVRSFSNTVEQGVGLMVPVPLGSTTITFKLRGRPTTAPGAATTVTHKVFSRQVPINAAMGAWSAATTFTAKTIPTNAYYQMYEQSYALSALGLAVNNTYHFELTRAIGGLANPWLVVEIVVEFT